MAVAARFMRMRALLVVTVPAVFVRVVRVRVRVSV